MHVKHLLLFKINWQLHEVISISSGQELSLALSQIISSLPPYLMTWQTKAVQSEQHCCTIETIFYLAIACFKVPHFVEVELEQISSRPPGEVSYDAAKNYESAEDRSGVKQYPDETQEILHSRPYQVVDFWFDKNTLLLRKEGLKLISHWAQDMISRK